MSKIRSIDMLFLDDVFRMRDGYVLNFSNRTFAQFFVDELNVDINDQVYAVNGISKARRLRCFLKSVDSPTAVRTLKALWNYRETLRHQFGHADEVNNAEGRLLALIDRLEGRSESLPETGNLRRGANDRSRLTELRSELSALNGLAAQARGFAFEKFLKRFFDVYGLAAEEPFRLRGEQIDGSFELAGETYLLEAKWQGQPVGVAELHTFHGKIEQKAAWARGLFVSYGGYSEDGLVAFGRGKRLICMDGTDVCETLNRELPLNHVLQRKVRRAAETGSPFVRVHDLFAE